MNNHPLLQSIDDFYKSLALRSTDFVGVAFSGGSDSVALLAATSALGIKCVALHCNFHLRGLESDRDEAFARSMAQRLGCGFASVSFDATSDAATTGESIEMACRRLRYKWFERVLAKGVDATFFQNEGESRWIKPAYIAMGHHVADNVETFMLNLSRSAGLNGLCGIPPKRHKFIRPMLDSTKSLILDYLSRNGLDYVTDSTNLLPDCQRNVWRLNLLPAIESEFPGFSQAVNISIEHLNDERRLLNELIDKLLPDCISDNGNIHLDSIANFASFETLLWHLMQRSGGVFPKSTAKAVVKSWRERRSGRIFRSTDAHHAYELHHNELIPFECCSEERQSFPIPENLIAEGGCIHNPLHLKFEVLPISDFKPRRDASAIWLDREAVLAEGKPLILRRWHHSDRISPFGMKGSRLISDVFSDAHLSLVEKRNAWLLTCGESVLWIVGMRASRHFAITESTSTALYISSLK